MLFYNNRSADDRAVRRALSKVDHYGGQVFVDAHWIKSVSRYQAIARGVDVEQSPTIVVADRNLKAESLVGYVDRRDDRPGRRGRAPSPPAAACIRNPYFRKVDRVCASAEQQVKALRPQPDSAAAIPAYLDGVPGGQRRHGDAGRRHQAAPQEPTHLPQGLRRPTAPTASAILAAAAAAAKANPAGASHGQAHGQAGQGARQEVRRQERRARPQLLLGLRPRLGA